MDLKPLHKKFGQLRFSNLYEFQALFSDEQKCRQYLAEAIWPDGPVCPYCNKKKIYKFANGVHYKCAKCRKKFTVTINTVFQSSKVPLSKWFLAMYFLGCHKKGISSMQLARDIGVRQKTAWFMLHRLRAIYSQAEEPKTQLEGIISADETFCGGKNKNRHWDKKVEQSQGRSFRDKTPVLGILQNGEYLRAFVIPDTSQETIQPIILRNVKFGATLMTDEWYAYYGLEHVYNHCTVDHSRKQYVNGDVTTNDIESAWACLKRMIIGIYHFTSKKHLQRYVDEMAFRFNHRKTGCEEAIMDTLQVSYGKRLTYSKLVA